MHMGHGISFAILPCKLVKRSCIRMIMAGRSSHFRSFDGGLRRTFVCVGVFIISNIITAYVVRSYTCSIEPRYNHPVRPCSAAQSIYRNFSSDTSTQQNMDSQPTIYVITPTYSRHTQKVDLTSSCQTFMLTPKLVWIIIEDSEMKTELVTGLLNRCRVQSVHLNTRTPDSERPAPFPLSVFSSNLRGVRQRNAGIQWLRDHCATNNCSSGVVYFGDDDNKYDLRVFDEIRKTENTAVFSVGFAGGLKFEGPVCKDGKVEKWHTASDDRKMPIDMAGFAISVRLILERPDVVFGTTVSGKQSKKGQLETDLLEHFTTRREVECRGSNKEVFVWHTKTMDPYLLHELRYRSSSEVEYKR